MLTEQDWDSLKHQDSDTGTEVTTRLTKIHNFLISLEQEKEKLGDLENQASVIYYLSDKENRKTAKANWVKCLGAFTKVKSQMKALTHLENIGKHINNLEVNLAK